MPDVQHHKGMKLFPTADSTHGVLNYKFNEKSHNRVKRSWLTTIKTNRKKWVSFLRSVVTVSIKIYKRSK